MDLIAELELDLSYTEEKMRARIFRPVHDPEQDVWSCIIEIDDPIGLQRQIYGVSSMQALLLGLKTLSAHLYGSDLYRNGELGLHGQFGGNLSLPAPEVMLDRAPFPF